MTFDKSNLLQFNLPLDDEEAIRFFLNVKEPGPRLLYLTALELAPQEQVEASQRAKEILELLSTDERTRHLVEEARTFGAVLKKLPKSKAKRRF